MCFCLPGRGCVAAPRGPGRAMAVATNAPGEACGAEENVLS